MGDAMSNRLLAGLEKTPPGSDASIGRDEVQRIAELAHLALSPEELERMTSELAKILDYVAALEQLDVTDVPPTAHVQLERLPLRADEPGESLPQELSLREAPRSDRGGFAVPAFVDEG